MDTSTISDRIKNTREERELTLQEVANDVGVARSTIQRYETGTIENMKLPVLEAIARSLRVNPAWLIGKGDSKNLPEPFDIFSIPGILPIETKKIPLLGEIACGVPKYEDEDFQGYVEVGTNIQADYAIRAKGDSMIGAFIRDGDLVFVRQQSTVENGDIVVISIDGEITLKRFKQVNDTVFLIPENSEYDIITVDLKNNNSIRILGKAVAFQSDAR